LYPPVDIKSGTLENTGSGYYPGCKVLLFNVNSPLIEQIATDTPGI
jgi:hypothetical protein